MDDGYRCWDEDAMVEGNLAEDDVEEDVAAGYFDEKPTPAGDFSEDAIAVGCFCCTEEEEEEEGEEPGYF